MNQPIWHLFVSAGQLAERAATWIENQAQRTLAKQEVFKVVLAGGRTPARVYEFLAKRRAYWPAWRFYLGDERCLPVAHPERNSQMVWAHWLAHIEVQAEQFFPIPAERGPEQGAREYGKIVQAAWPFDLLLLGLGEDGHTASLFPGHRHPPSAWVVPVHWAPKPPPQRVSLNYPAFERAAAVLFLVTGESKQWAVRRWREGGALPASRVHGANRPHVFVDLAAWNHWVVYMTRDAKGHYRVQVGKGALLQDLMGRRRRFSSARSRAGAGLVYLEACVSRVQAGLRRTRIERLCSRQKRKLACAWLGHAQDRNSLRAGAFR